MSEIKTTRIFVRLTEQEHDKFLRLGGSVWLREQLKKAKGPARKA